MKLSVYGCIFLAVLGLMSACQSSERAPVETKPASGISTKSAASLSAEDYNNSGTAYQRAGRLQEAALAYQRAVLN